MLSTFLFLVATSIATAAPSQASQLPNVIVIVTDDQGYGDFSVHGNPVLKTPNMDRLAKESIRFTDFHVAPMCSPTRGQLMTGMDAMKNGCTAVCQGRSMIREEIPTMANYFAEAGYATGHFGKWHLGDSNPHRPQDRGFQETLHHRAWGITSLADHWGNTYFDPVLEHNGKDQKYTGYCTDIFFSEAMKWVASKQRSKQPFFLYLPTNTPHVPNVCAEQYSKPYVGKHQGKRIPSEFYGMVANLDENLGKLEAFLVEQGLRENTILVYLSDNKTQSTEAAKIFNAGMRAKKTSVYEGGHRVPLFFRWPGGDINHDRDVDELTQVQDILPTLMEFCGLQRSEDQKLDGTSLAGLLTDSSGSIPDRKLVIQYQVSGEPWDSAVVMWNKWRLMKRPPSARTNARDEWTWELYHIGRDPGQTDDMATENPEIVDAMANHYRQWYAEAKPLFDKKRWIVVGSDAAADVNLYSQDWVGDYCDNPRGLAQSTSFGHWNVVVEQPGTYEIELRRWPAESNKPLIEGWTGPNDQGPSARPIAAARLQIAGQDKRDDVNADQTMVVFTAELPQGPTQLKTTFFDARGEAICSAIYCSIRLVVKSTPRN